MVTNTRRENVLASGSPRRQALLAQMGFRPVVAVPSVPEVRDPGETPLGYTQRLARAKAAAAPTATGHPAWILAADTIVVCDGDVLEKPADGPAAHAMLRRLSGRWHTVITSFSWLHRRDGRHDTRSVQTDVHFRELTDELVERYIATGEPMDKAGAYGIQGVGAAFCREIRGSYSCVVGLPICEVVESLQALGGLEEFPFHDE